MSKKNVIFGICTTIVIAAIVYIIGGFIIDSVANNKKDSNTLSDKTVNSNENQAPVSSYGKESSDVDTIDDKDVFEYFRDKNFNDVVAYSNELTQRQITIDKNKVSFVGNGDIKVDCTAPVELDDESVIAVDFVDSNNGVFFVTQEASAGNIYFSVYTTNDAGTKWVEQPVAHFAGEIINVHMIDNDNIAVITAGGAYATNVINFSKDGAKSFEVVENDIIEADNGTIYPVKDTADNKVFLVASMDNDSVSNAIMYKLDSDWSVIDSYEIRIQ